MLTEKENLIVSALAALHMVNPARKAECDALINEISEKAKARNVCPNCGQPIDGHPDDGCMLNALIIVLRDRGELEPDVINRLHANCDPDLLWNRIGPIVDDLGVGAFNHEEG